MSVEIKFYYSAKELASMNLKSLPASHANVRNKATKENWITRKRSGRGGGQEYLFDGLPKDVQAEIKAKSYKALMP